MSEFSQKINHCLEVPPVTVCIPTYKRIEGLKKAIGSAQSQNYPDFHILVSDNGDSDEVEALVRELSTEKRPIQLFRQKINLGSAGNFNFLFDQVETEYFIWLADDDYFEEDYIRKCMEEHQKRKDFVLISGHGFIYNEKGVGYLCEKMNLVQDSKYARLIRYWWNVLGNSVFYGVYRKSMMSGIRIEEGWGSDVRFISEVVLRGKVLTVEGIHSHRSQGASAETVKKGSGLLGWLLWRYPRMRITNESVRYFLRTRPFFQATLLSMTFTMISVWRFVFIREISALRVQLSLRSKIRKLYAS